MSTSATSVPSTSGKSKPKKSAFLSKTTEIETEPVVIAEEEPEAGETEPEGQEPDYPETVAVPGCKRKGKPMPFKTADLKGKVLNLWMDVQQCAREFLNPGTPTLVGRWNDVYGYLTKINFQETQLFLAEVQWKIIVKFNPMLWKCLGTRWASPTERAMYNFMATLPQDIMPLERLREKARKDIGESTEFLEGPGDNRLEPGDIWRRMMKELDGLAGINEALHQLEGHRRTAIVASGLPNACAILRLMNDYALAAMGRRSDLRLLELADGGTLRLTRFARNMVSWHFGVEELVVAALDMGNKGRAACQEGHVTFGKYQSLEYYLGTNLYDPAIDIGLVECSCTPDVVDRLKNCPNTQTVGNERRRWRTEEETANLRTPAVLCLGGCCSAFAPGNNPKKDSRELDRFLNSFVAAARERGQDPDLEPLPIGPENPYDLTLGNQFDETLGPVRQRGRLLNLRPYKTGDEVVVGIENALIVVSRVALAPGDAIAFGPRKPLLVNLWIGNGFGRTLAIFEGDYTPRPLPYGAVEYNGNRVPEEVMRTTILSLLGCSNILVGFQVGWTLAALNLVLPGHRVVYLGIDPAFQSWCRRLLPRRPGWRNAFVENMINSYDRRIPAVLYEIDLCSTPGEVDPVREI